MRCYPARRHSAVATTRAHPGATFAAAGRALPSTVFAPDGSAPSRARYSNVLIKKDGQWLLSSVREAAYSEPTNYEHLKGLEWTIGEWGDEQPNGPVGRVSFEWAPGQNFIV